MSDPPSTTNPPTGTTGLDSSVVAGIIAICVAVAVLILVLVIYLRLKRTRGKSRLEPLGDLPHSHSKRYVNHQSGRITTTTDNTKDINPANPYEAFSEGKSISRSSIVFQIPLGHLGQAELFSGTFQDNPSAQLCIKKYKPTVSKAQVMDEAQILRQIGPHPSLLKYIGVLHDSQPFLILSEMMEEGSLRSYLRQLRGCYRHSDSQLVKQLTTMAKQICSGVAFLHSKQIIHAHLAARCILVGQQGSTCVISEVERFYVAQSNDVPFVPVERDFPWCAPESITSGTFTLKSDMWSLGVVLWELFTFGATPFIDFELPKIPAIIEHGVRLPTKSLGFSTSLSNLLAACWQLNTQSRPVMDQVIETVNSGKGLTKLIRELPPIDESREEEAIQLSVHQRTLFANWTPIPTIAGSMALVPHVEEPQELTVFQRKATKRKSVLDAEFDLDDIEELGFGDLEL